MRDSPCHGSEGAGQSTDGDHNSGSLGGAIANLGRTTVKRSSKIRFNHASSGGGIATGNANVVVRTSKIAHNDPDNCNPLNTIPGCVD